MNVTDRAARLAVELATLRSLKSKSLIFEFEAKGDPPDSYIFTFLGKGLARALAASLRVSMIDVHRVEVRLPFSFPDSPPDIRWLTPLFHPNVPNSGAVNLREVGLPWESFMGLDTVAERLWDVARLAHFDLDQASDPAASQWIREQKLFTLPVDSRPLRDLEPVSPSNVVRYERIGDRRVISPPDSPPREILYIGEETPTPELPINVVPRRRGTQGEGEVLYIGDDCTEEVNGDAGPERMTE